VLATKENIAKIAIGAISSLIAIKVVASILTGSIAIRADATHSAIDLVGLVIGYIGIRISGKPPDERHPFGHGKAESIASAIIAGLMFVAVGIFSYQAVNRLITGTVLELVTVGIYITAAAIAINATIAWQALRVARTTDSIALEASARDMLADVWSSCAVLVGLILVRQTGISIIDPIVALVVAGLIARTAYLIMRKSFGGLMDTTLPKAEEEAIRSYLMEQSSQIVSFHALRTRKAGNQRFIDLHLVMPKNVTLEEAHLTCDHLEQDIKDRLKRTNITIHVEPCSEECEQCTVSCSLHPDND